MSTHVSLKMESTAILPEQAHPSRAVSLESLPSEIKVMILCHMLEVSSLRDIVHASPTYHQVYLGAREEILHNITSQTLQKNNIGLLDPWTAIHAPQLEYHIPHRVEIIAEYLERYAQGFMDGSRRRLEPRDSLAILSLHTKFTVLIQKFCDTNLQNPFTGLQDEKAAPLAPSELYRLYRAFWRYEIYSKLFGPRLASPYPFFGPDMPPSFTDVEIAHEFFGLFPIHEVEELACLRKYAEDTYSPCCVQYYVDSLIAFGPTFLYEVLTAPSKDERVYRIEQKQKTEWVIYVTPRFALDAYESDLSWGSWQWKGMYDNLISERVPTTGWLWASSRGVQNTDFRLRGWGYVFWNQERLDGWGVTEENMINWPDSRKASEAPVRQT